MLFYLLGQSLAMQSAPEKPLHTLFPDNGEKIGFICYFVFALRWHWSSQLRLGPCCAERCNNHIKRERKSLPQRFSVDRRDTELIGKKQEHSHEHQAGHPRQSEDTLWLHYLPWSTNHWVTSNNRHKTSKIYCPRIVLAACSHRRVGKRAQGRNRRFWQTTKELFQQWWLLNKLTVSKSKVLNIRAGRFSNSPPQKQ